MGYEDFSLRVVIDTNALQTDELRGFLAMCPDHLAVITDYVAMESFKPGRLDGLLAQFSVLKDFPAQVLVLKGTGDISRMSASAEDMAAEMVSDDETAAFPNFCSQIKIAALSPQMSAQLAQRTTWSRDHMDTMLVGLSDMNLAMAEFRAPFTPAELSAIRRGDPLTPNVGRKVFDLALSMAEAVFTSRKVVGALAPAPEHRSQHFIFRNALCYAIYMLSRTRVGAVDRAAVKARNDTIDVLLATYGTYFDGVMSADALTNEVHHVAWNTLRALGIHTGGDYLSGMMMQVADFLEVQS